MYTPEEFFELCRATRWDALQADSFPEVQRVTERIERLQEWCAYQEELRPIMAAWVKWARNGGKQPLLSDLTGQSHGQLSVYTKL